MNRKSLCLLALAGALVVGCSDSNNPFKSHNKSEASSANERMVTTADVPSTVQEAFRRDHPYATISSVGMQSHTNGRTNYVFHYTDQQGSKKTDTYNANGVKVGD